MLRIIVAVLALSLPAFANAGATVFKVEGGQVSVPAGLTVQVKSVAVGEDAITVRIMASFDSRLTSYVNMTDNDNAYLSWSDADTDRLFMRMLSDNPYMRISNGQTMEGDLVFPGTLPVGVEQLQLVFNPGVAGDDTSGPGVTIPLKLKP